jgi:large-conductance mechanosensitive channel
MAVAAVVGAGFAVVVDCYADDVFVVLLKKQICEEIA